ncbi:MAG: hypothetical protein QNL94_01300, partial [Halioglobus sp.]
MAFTIRSPVFTAVRRRFFPFCVLFGLGLLGCQQDDESRLYDHRPISETPPDQEWRSYLGDKGFSHYSTLAQIDTSSVSRLQEVWRYDAGGASENGATQMQCSAIVIEGILYCTSPLLHLFALNAATGEELWRFNPSSDFGLLPNPNRGVAYWEGYSDDATAAPEGVPRILFTAGSFLYAINARTGKPILAFGNDGKVDLHEGLSTRFSDEAINATTPGSVYKDL